MMAKKGRKDELVRIEITLNPNKHKDILVYLDKLDNKAGYIKSLLIEHIRLQNKIPSQNLISNKQESYDTDTITPEKPERKPEKIFDNMKLTSNLFSSSKMNIDVNEQD